MFCLMIQNRFNLPVMCFCILPIDLWSIQLNIHHIKFFVRGELGRPNGFATHRQAQGEQT